VVAFLDNKDNIYPRKEQPANKIDGVVAALIALNRLMVYSEADVGKALSEALEQRGMISL
jgi:phage terminase large subunit-like protein